MSRCPQVGRPIALVRCLRHQQQQHRHLAGPASSIAARRYLSGTPSRQQDDGEKQQQQQQANTPAAADKNKGPQSKKPQDTDFKRRKLDPNVTTLPWAEKELLRRGTPPVGSRRRRAAVRTSQNIPFEQMPYQCFQEARKLLREDRDAKVRQIVAETDRIRKLEAADPAQFRGGEAYRQKRLASLRKYVDQLKILADINDPLVKRRFEDGMGDMNKPIYRYLAEKRWQGYPRRLIQQRIAQFHIVPDLLPKFEPTMDVQLFFRRFKVSPGELVDSAVSEAIPRLRVQTFRPGERLVSVVVVDSDVPRPETDDFGRRCHYLAANVPLSPAVTSLPLAKADPAAQLAVPWLPAFSQKGAPYHRLSVFVLEQPAGSPPIDVGKLRELYSGRDGFSLKSFRDKFGLDPVGFSMFRTVWDKGTAGVMERAGIPGADVEFKRQKVEPLREPKKQRGWEAKRQGPKYKHLWKYTKRIASPSGKYVR